MKIRYKQGLKGPEAVAKVYNIQEHGISKNSIDKDALNIIEKLIGHGYESYVVGGAVRDLMLGKMPKDFDIVTSASPRQVHKLFYNSRIIGRRFKIVHVAVGNKLFEVSTFRSINDHADSYENEFGTIEEDAKRRDFSINSLYYDIQDETIIDFNNAFEDFKQKKIRSVIPLSYTFIEDPVRMIRALKINVTTGFRLKWSISVAIRKYSPNLEYVSSSRMTEELNKILSSGFSAEIFKKLVDYRLFAYILPCMSVYANAKEFYESLNKLDAKVKTFKEKNYLNFDKSILYYWLTEPFIIINKDIKKSNELYKDVFRQIKILISPNTPANFEIENAAVAYLRNHGIRYQKPSREKKSVQPSKKHG